MTRRLQIEYALVVGLAGLLAGLYETGLWEAGSETDYGTTEYVLETTGILLLIALVPMGLKLLSLKGVRQRIAFGTPGWERSYRRWCEVRLALITVPLLWNLSLYYQLMNTTYSVCAVIAALALLFGWPSEARMEQETGKGTRPDGKDNELQK